MVVFLYMQLLNKLQLFLRSPFVLIVWKDKTMKIYLLPRNPIMSPNCDI